MLENCRYNIFQSYLYFFNGDYRFQILCTRGTSGYQGFGSHSREKKTRIKPSKKNPDPNIKETKPAFFLTQYFNCQNFLLNILLKTRFILLGILVICFRPKLDPDPTFYKTESGSNFFINDIRILKTALNSPNCYN